MSKLNQLTATDAARQIGAGRIKSEDLVRACIDRIREREPELKAWVHCDFDAALAQARVVDRSSSRGALAGVPVGFKDVIDTADLPTQYNSPIYEGHRPRTDAACVALSRRAGAIVLGKTVTTEFASTTPGPTRNPHNLEYSPGGSSSGSAAAVADFMVPLAFGTQTGGSTIRPSAYCGVVGYKPSFGTINRAGLKQLGESLDTIGVIGRTVSDCALLVHATSARELPDFEATLPAPTIGVWRTSRWSEATAATQSLLEETASALAKRGAKVSDFALPDDFDALYDEQPLISGFEAARSLAAEHLSDPEKLSEPLRRRLDKYRVFPREQYSAAMRHARTCRLRLSDLLLGIDVLLTPSAPGEAPQGIATTGSSLFNRNWTLLGVPCVTLPAGVGPQRLPLGVQVVGDYDNDARVLWSAEWTRRALS